MKKYLRLLALIVASAIPGLAMAATDYGITIGGTKVTSDNASSITGTWLRSGSIRYNYSTNTLTLSNADIYDGGIIVNATCKDFLRISVNGICNVTANGIAIQVKNAAGASSTDVFFQGSGEGILNLNYLYQGNVTVGGNSIYTTAESGKYPWICIGNGTQGGEATHSALTLNAEEIRGDGGGNLYITDGCVNLKGQGGNRYATIRGFSNVYTPYSSSTGQVNKIWTEGVSYNTSSQRLEKNGSLYTGAVYAGWEKYGLRICGIEVTCKNKGDISDHTNPAVNNLAICQHGSTSSNGLGSLTYNPSTNTLTFGDNNRTGVDLRQDRGKIDAPAIENNTGKTLIITTKTASDITTEGTSRHGIVSDQSITFNGGSSTQLGIKTDQGNSIRLTADDLTLKFDLAKVNFQSWPSECINTDSPSEHRWTWTLYDCNVTTLGCVRGVKAYNMTGCGIATEKVIIDPYGGNANSPMGHLRLFKEGEYFGTFEIKRASTTYGFSIAGIQVNNVNANNLYNEFVTNGTAVYNASANTLTLTDFQVDYQNKKQATSINIGASAPQGLAIVANGNNYFKNAQSGGMACAITNASGASVSSPSRWLRGTGTLDFGEKGSIGLYDGVWFTIGGNNLSGAAANVTLKGGSIAGNSSSQAVLQVSEGNLELAGSSYGTARYLRSFFGPSYTDHEMLPSTVSYDSTDGRVENASGSVYTGALTVGWKKYGLSVCNVPVTAGNKNCLADLINQKSTKVAATTASSNTTPAAADAIKYDPSNNRLTLNNVSLWDNYNSNRGEAVIDNQTGQSFFVYTSGKALIVRSDGQPCGIRSNSMLTIMGGDLEISGVTANNAKALIVMDGDDLALRFWNSSNTTLEGSGTSAPAVCCAQAGQWLRLETHDCNLSTTGVLKNISKYTADRTGITNNKVIWDSKSRSFITWGSTNSLVTSVNFAKATSYGITIAGLDLNTVTKSNFYCEAIKAGSVSYDERAGEVTLNNVQADMSTLGGSNSGITIKESAVDKLKLNIVGYNTFTGYNNAIAMLIYKEKDASLSAVSRYITGTGTLDLGSDGIICLDNQPWICIGNGVQGGEGLGGVTVKATSMYGQAGGFTARVSITDGALELSGSKYGTLYNINSLFGPDYDGMEMTPSTASFNSSNSRVEQNGAVYTGALRIGWEDYGLSICGTKVTGGNKDNIRITTNINAQNLVMARNGTSHIEEAAAGAVKYTPSSNTLTLTDVDLADFNNTNYGEAVIDNKTGKAFTIKTIGAVQLNTAFGKQKACIRTNSDITFQGSQLWFSTADQTSSCLLMDGNHLLASFANGSNTELNGTYGTGDVGSAIDVVNAGDKCRVQVGKCQLKMVGSCHNFEYFNFNGSAIQTEGVFVNEDEGKLFKNSYGNISEHDYITEIVPVTTEYGLTVGGHPVNNVTMNNFHFADLTGTVSYSPRENLLTLTDVKAGCKRKIIVDGVVKDSYFNGLNVTSSATNYVTIQLKGDNIINHIDGVGMVLYKSTTLCGDGTLKLLKSGDNQAEKFAAIYLYNNSNLVMSDVVKVYALQLVGYNGQGGGLYLNRDDYRATLDLTGDGSTATVRGLSGVHNAFGSGRGGYGEVYTMTLIPNNGFYDYNNFCMRKNALDAYAGSIEKGRVLFGPATDYGIMINSFNVNSFNAEDIIAGTEYEYSGKLSYDEATNVLTMNNLKLQSAGNLTSFTVNSTSNEKWFSIYLIGENEWTDPTDMVFKAGNVQFIGDGSLTYPNEIILSRDQSQLSSETGSFSADQGLLSFFDCTINAASIRSTVSNMNGMVNGEVGFYNSDITLTGSAQGTISGFDSFWINSTKVITPAGGEWYDNDGISGNHYTYLTDGSGNKHTGLVEIYPSYGIFVAGTEVTSKNKNDVLGDGGSVSYTPASNGNDNDPYGWMAHLILKRANINGNIVMMQSGDQDDILVQLNGESTINSSRDTGIRSEIPFTVWSKDAYGKLFINGTGSGVDLTHDAVMTIANSELNINVGTYGIRGTYTDQTDATGTYMGGYESVSILGNDPYSGQDPTGAPTGESGTYYSKLVVKNSSSRYPLVSALDNFYMENCTVMEPARAYFNGNTHTFDGSNGSALANTTLVISNADYNTVGIEEMNNERMNNEQLSGDVYDLSGRKMNNHRIQRGIYVVGGKKVAVK